jgi:hypothetical protein
MESAQSAASFLSPFLDSRSSARELAAKRLEPQRRTGLGVPCGSTGCLKMNYAPMELENGQSKTTPLVLRLPHVPRSAT